MPKHFVATFLFLENWGVVDMVKHKINKKSLYLSASFHEITIDFASIVECWSRNSVLHASLLRDVEEKDPHNLLSWDKARLAIKIDLFN